MPVDPCAEATRLRELRTSIITGQSEAQVRFGDEEVRYHKADMDRLDREIARYDAACRADGKPARYAKRLRFSGF